MTRAQPLLAATASAGAFAVGALPPLLLALLLPQSALTASVFAASLLLLCMLGAVAARLGGANLAHGALRVGFWGALAMVVTGIAGRLFGVAF